MITYSATFAADHVEQLRRRLHLGHSCEHAAYVLFNHAAICVEPWDREAHRMFLCGEVVPIKDDQVFESTPKPINWKTASFVVALKRAEETGLFVGIVHSRPGKLSVTSKDSVVRLPSRVRAR
jgi:hypothetical protein